MTVCKQGRLITFEPLRKIPPACSMAQFARFVWKRCMSLPLMRRQSGRVGTAPNGSEPFRLTMACNGSFMLNSDGFIMARPTRTESGSGKRMRAGYGAERMPGLTCGDTTRAAGCIISRSRKAGLFFGTTKASPTNAGRAPLGSSGKVGLVSA